MRPYFWELFPYCFLFPLFIPLATLYDIIDKVLWHHIIVNIFRRNMIWRNPFPLVKVTYLGIRSAHERVWLVERKPIWLLRAYLTRGDLEPARGNLHVCKFLRELTNIQIRTVTAERKLCSECICPTNVLQLKEGRKQASKGRKEGRQARTRRRKRGRRNSYRERGRKRSTQYALNPTTVSSLELIQESVSYCLLRPLLTTPLHLSQFLSH